MDVQVDPAMGTCEMCGDQADLTKTKVEGAVLKVCDDCASVGESVESSYNSGSTSRQRKSSSSSGSKELAPDYDDLVKEAREDAGMTVSDLAGALKEKDSVVRRIESGKLTPNKNLARKLERELDIDLYESYAGVTAPKSSENRRQKSNTIGDVVTVKDSDS